MNESLEHLHKDYELLSSLKGKTLTLNVQDGRVSGNTDQDVRWVVTAWYHPPSKYCTVITKIRVNDILNNYTNMK